MELICPAFNPTVVRLRQSMQQSGLPLMTSFQSHCGAIATNRIPKAGDKL